MIILCPCIADACWVAQTLDNTFAFDRFGGKNKADGTVAVCDIGASVTIFKRKSDIHTGSSNWQASSTGQACEWEAGSGPPGSHIQNATDTWPQLPAGILYRQQPNTRCAARKLDSAGQILRYDSVDGAEAACESMPTCAGIYDDECNSQGYWSLCVNATNAVVGASATNDASSSHAFRVGIEPPAIFPTGVAMIHELTYAHGVATTELASARPGWTGEPLLTFNLYWTTIEACIPCSLTYI